MTALGNFFSYKFLRTVQSVLRRLPALGKIRAAPLGFALQLRGQLIEHVDRLWSTTLLPGCWIDLPQGRPKPIAPSPTANFGGS